MSLVTLSPNFNNNKDNHYNNINQPLLGNNGTTNLNNIFNRGTNNYLRMNPFPLNINSNKSNINSIPMNMNTISSNNVSYSPINYMNNLNPFSQNNGNPIYKMNTTLKNGINSMPINGKNISPLNNMNPIDMKSPIKQLNLVSPFKHSPTMISPQNMDSPTNLKSLNIHSPTMMSPLNMDSPIMHTPKRNSGINNDFSIKTPFHSPTFNPYFTPRNLRITYHPRILSLIGSPSNEINLNNGLEQKVINNLPESKIKDVSKLTSEKKKCIICLDEFINDEYLACLPCIHAFHSKCIKNWLKRNKECPICKFKITDETLNYQEKKIDFDL